MSNFLKAAEKLKTSGLNPEVLKMWENMKKTTKHVESVIKSNIKDVRSGYDQSKGIEFIGFLDYATEGKTDPTDQTKIARPSVIRIKIIELPDSVNENYGCVESDMESTDVDVKNAVNHVDIHNNPYSPKTKNVLKVKVRSHANPVTGFKYTKDNRVKERHVFGIQYIDVGDIIRGSVFVLEKPKMENGQEIQPGSIVIVRGAKAHEYEGRVQWNFSSVTLSSVNPMDTYGKMFEEQIEYPRNMVEFRKIDEPPIDWTVRPENRAQQNLSEELSKYISTEVPIYTWPTDDSDEARVVVELSKKFNAIYTKATFSRDPQFYITEIEEQNKPSKFYLNGMFTQTVNLTDLRDPENPSTNKISLDVNIRERQCEQILGISNPGVYKAVAAEHMQRLNIALTCKPDHKDSYNRDMNNASAKKQEFNEIDYMVVYKTTPTSFGHSNLFQHVYDEGIPVTFQFVKEVVGRGSDAIKSNWHEKNFYNMLQEALFINLSEYTGSLSDFGQGFQFRVLSNKPPSKRDFAEIKKLSAKDRAEKCSESLLGNGDDVQRESDEEMTAAIFALSDSLCEQIENNHDMFDFSDFIRRAENAHARCDPYQERKKMQEMKKDFNKKNILKQGWTPAGKKRPVGSNASDSEDSAQKSEGGKNKRKRREQDDKEEKKTDSDEGESVSE